jgi:molybdate transport system substrate-binding protein
MRQPDPILLDLDRGLHAASSSSFKAPPPRRPLRRVVSGALLALALPLGLGFAQTARAVNVVVMNSGGFTAAYNALAPKYHAASGNTVSMISGPSMGQSKEAIPNRLARGEHADVVIMVGYALDDLIKQGKVVKGSRRELSDSRIGMVVRQGAPKPDISTPDAFKNTLLQARSVAYSDSASGVYIQNEMFKKMGIEAQLKPKATMVPRIPVAGEVAKGTYQYGFQQVSELLPIAGVDFVGKIPESVQSVTRYAAGVPVNAEHPKEGQAFIDQMASPASADAISKTGMDPLAK